MCASERTQASMQWKISKETKTDKQARCLFKGEHELEEPNFFFFLLVCVFVINYFRKSGNSIRKPEQEMTHNSVPILGTLWSLPAS